MNAGLFGRDLWSRTHRTVGADGLRRVPLADEVGGELGAGGTVSFAQEAYKIAKGSQGIFHTYGRDRCGIFGDAPAETLMLRGTPCLWGRTFGVFRNSSCLLGGESASPGSRLV